MRQLVSSPNRYRCSWDSEPRPKAFKIPCHGNSRWLEDDSSLSAPARPPSGLHTIEFWCSIRFQTCQQLVVDTQYTPVGTVELLCCQSRDRSPCWWQHDRGCKSLQRVNFVRLSSSVSPFCHGRVEVSCSSGPLTPVAPLQVVWALRKGVMCC